MEYEINSDTLAIIPYQKGKSKILELNDEYIVDLTPYQVIENSCSYYGFDGDVINTILDESCIYYGSSLNGRMNGARSILGSVYKTPVMVEETNNLIFFPTTAIENEKNVWIGSNNILNYEKKGKNTVVEWKNNKKTEFNMPILSIETQLLRVNKLITITKQRKN